MQVRPEFTRFIQSSTGVSKPEVAEVAAPAGGDAEQYIPQLVEETAVYFDKVSGSLPENQLEALKKPLATLLEKHPAAQEAFLSINDAVLPEGIPVGYKAGPKPGLFSVNIHEFNLGGNGNSLYGDKQGTLFVDTTPATDGIQCFFHPAQGVNR